MPMWHHQFIWPPLITTQHETEQTTIETSLPDVSAKCIEQ
jgi:hypothetical protein